MLVYCFACSSTLKMKTIYLSEGSVEFQRITWCYIPEKEPFITTAVKTTRLI
jgi:hypothetical protein